MEVLVKRIFRFLLIKRIKVYLGNYYLVICYKNVFQFYNFVIIIENFQIRNFLLYYIMIQLKSSD